MAAAALAAALPLSATAAPRYWDGNGTTPGAGTAPTGNWGGASDSQFWSTTSGGTSGTGAWVTGDDAVFAAGDDATGTYTVTQGAAQTAGSLAFEEGTVSIVGGQNLTLNGSANVSVADGLTASIVSIFTSGSAGFNKVGGGTLELGFGTGAAGGSINVTAVPITIQAGTLKITKESAGGSSSAISNSATLRVDAGGTFDTNGRNETVATLILNGGTVTNTDASNNADQPTAGFATATTYDLRSGSLNARITGAGTLNKTTSGTVTISKGSSFSGATNINEGRLVVTGALASGAGIIQVNNTGVLAGSGVGTDGPSAAGSVGRVSVNSGGTIAPGTDDNTTGLLLVRSGDTNGGFTLGAGGALDIEIGGTTAGTGYDQLIVTGGATAAVNPVSLAGNLNVSLLNSFAPNDGDLFFILEQRLASAGTGSVGAVNGTFAGLADGAEFFVGDEKFKISYSGDVGSNSFTGGNDVVLQSIAVPEPGSVAVLGALAALTLAGRRRRA